MQTTRVCPTCGCCNLVLIGSQNMKICPDCKTKIQWVLQSGQKGVHGGTINDELFCSPDRCLLSTS